MSLPPPHLFTAPGETTQSRHRAPLTLGGLEATHQFHLEEVPEQVVWEEEAYLWVPTSPRLVLLKILTNRDLPNMGYPHRIVFNLYSITADPLGGNQHSRGFSRRGHGDPPGSCKRGSWKHHRGPYGTKGGRGGQQWNQSWAPQYEGPPDVWHQLEPE